MNISKLAVGAFLSMILLAIFLANVISLISTHSVHPDDHLKERFFKISDRFDNLIWFLQISDIHISIFRDPSRITEFKEFCHYTIDRIKPKVVLATGDLTDAKTKDAIGSQQYETEWRHYRDILNEYDIQNKTFWLDIRGNHDNFNVISIKSKENYFTNYSVQGRVHPRSYMVQVRKGNAIYSFIGVDACLEPGPRRPFNFVGVLDQPEVDEINRLIKKTEASGSNYTLWFGHFPTSCILSSGNENIRNLIRKDKNGFAYVCGHLHTLGGIVPKMYTMQKGGYLELELGDWKDNRMYRLMALDHGMFSFIDIRHRDWPVALVTNPKHALFLNPLKENLQNIRESTHIRVLAFSLSRIKTVRIRINSEPWTDLKHIKGPLYVATWDPNRYKHGVHKIEGLVNFGSGEARVFRNVKPTWFSSLTAGLLTNLNMDDISQTVYVKDIEGREKTEKLPFSLDGTKISFGVLPRIALMSNLSCIFWSFFLATLLVYLLPLMAMKYFHRAVTAGYISQPKLRGNFLKMWLKKLWMFTTIDRIFWPVVLYPLYLVFGPWSIGYIVEDYIGVIFSWGIFVDGAFLPGSFTYAYGFIQLVTFQIPLTFILISAVYRRFNQLSLNTGKKLSLKQAICTHLPFCIVFTIQVVMAYLFWLAYGTLAFILGPLRTWSLILAAILYHSALRLPEKCFRQAKEICFTRSELSIEQEPTNVALDKTAPQVGKVN